MNGNGAQQAAPARLCNSMSVSGVPFESSYLGSNETGSDTPEQEDCTSDSCAPRSADAYSYYYPRLPRSSTMAVGSSSRSTTFCDVRLPSSVSGDFSRTRVDCPRTPSLSPTPAVSHSPPKEKEKEKRFAFARLAAFLRRGVAEKRPATESPVKQSLSGRSRSASTSAAFNRSVGNSNSKCPPVASTGPVGSLSRTPRGHKDTLETVLDADAEAENNADKRLTPIAYGDSQQSEEAVANEPILSDRAEQLEESDTVTPPFEPNAYRKCSTILYSYKLYLICLSS